MCGAEQRHLSAICRQLSDLPYNINYRENQLVTNEIQVSKNAFQRNSILCLKDESNIHGYNKQWTPHLKYKPQTK
jgi:hypothetical protein